MVALEHVGVVFAAGLASAVTTGFGAVPFFFIDEVGPRWSVRLWGLASGIMVVASLGGSSLGDSLVVRHSRWELASSRGSCSS